MPPDVVVSVHPAANVPVEPDRQLELVQAVSADVASALTTDAYAPNPAGTVVVLFYLQKNEIKKFMI